MLLLPQVWECFCGSAPADVAIGLTRPPVYSSRRPASPVSTRTPLAADKVDYCEKVPDPTDDWDIAAAREQLTVGKSVGAAQSSRSKTAVLGVVLLLSSTRLDDEVWLSLVPLCVVLKNAKPKCLRTKVKLSPGINEIKDLFPPDCRYQRDTHIFNTSHIFLLN